MLNALEYEQQRRVAGAWRWRLWAAVRAHELVLAAIAHEDDRTLVAHCRVRDAARRELWPMEELAWRAYLNACDGKPVQVVSG